MKRAASSECPFDAARASIGAHRTLDARRHRTKHATCGARMRDDGSFGSLRIAARIALGVAARHRAKVPQRTSPR
ncbi:hypothetical protein WI23_28300 [Burkholderia oklahomensis C6786]|nr:hypothetical protein WI23_28300 [Burkholderia oklahomensis C6786]KUY55667.1 hypothetical protein WI23_20645 [Burkholderia oklahomensis C6786]